MDFSVIAQPLLNGFVSYLSKHPEVFEQLAEVIVQLVVAEVKKAVPVQA